MPSEWTVRECDPGYQYVVYLGCDTDDHGMTIVESADRIIKGFKPLRGQARRTAKRISDSGGVVADA